MNHLQVTHAGCSNAGCIELSNTMEEDAHSQQLTPFLLICTRAELTLNNQIPCMCLNCACLA